MKLLQPDFEAMPRRKRTALINSLSGFKSVNLVGSISAGGIPNLSIVSSVVHIGANPPLMGFVMRPVSVTRDTYNNIIQTGSFTFNHISADFFKAAHQTSARYPSEISEFDEVGLHPEFSDKIKAPYVQESAIKMGLVLREEIQIKLNGTILIIGEVKELSFPEEHWREDGYLDIEAVGTVACSSLDSYHLTRRLARLSYAKPDQSLTEIP